MTFFAKSSLFIGIFLTISANLFTIGTAHAAKIDPGLAPFIDGQANQETIRVLALVDIDTAKFMAPRRYDSRGVTGFLRAAGYDSFQRVKNYLASRAINPRDVTLHRMFWINSALSASVTREGLKVLSEAPGVSKIYLNRMVTRDPVVKTHGQPHFFRSTKGSWAYDLVDMHIDKLRAEDPALIGTGVTIGQVDTGVDGKHPALSGRIKLFYDNRTRSKGEPTDKDEHGTHTAGTMVGTGPNGVAMGVAPGAMLVSAGPLSSYDDMLAGMEFMLNPDGDPNTADMPRAVNNSWNCGGAPDIELFYRAIAAWEAAGIVPVFSAGNSGPGKGTITPPHEHPGTFAVGATGADSNITNFSSRGPGVYHGQKTQKPDATAPGDDILSSVPGGKYETMSGTSMAAPHATGAAAILFQVDPRLTPAQLKSVFIQSAEPRMENSNPGKAGEWNATYGFGKLDLYAAVHLVKKVAAMRASGGNAWFLPGGIFSGPEMIEARMTLETPSDSLERAFAFPSELEGNSWIVPARIWND